MKKITLLALLLCTAILSGYTQKVTVDSDNSVDMSKYKTFSFLGWQNASDSALNDLDKKRLHDAFEAEFKKRNINKVDENQDMEISLYIVISNETSVTAYTTYMGGGSGYRVGTWARGYGTTNYSEYDYLKGTLVMDVFDPKTKNLIWEAVATGTVSEKPQKREKGIPKAIKKLMKKFPVEPIKE